LYSTIGKRSEKWRRKAISLYAASVIYMQIYVQPALQITYVPLTSLGHL
jgi:hypothetical protein